MVEWRGHHDSEFSQSFSGSESLLCLSDSEILKSKPSETPNFKPSKTLEPLGSNSESSESPGSSLSLPSLSVGLQCFVKSLSVWSSDIGLQGPCFIAASMSQGSAPSACFLVASLLMGFLRFWIVFFLFLGPLLFNICVLPLAKIITNN